MSEIEVPQQYYGASYSNMHYEQSSNTPVFIGAREQKTYIGKFPDYVLKPQDRPSWIERSRHAKRIRVLLTVAIMLCVFAIGLFAFYKIYMVKR